MIFSVRDIDERYGFSDEGISRPPFGGFDTSEPSSKFALCAKAVSFLCRLLKFEALNDDYLYKLHKNIGSFSICILEGNMII